MSDQPEPTDEWTQESLRQYLAGYSSFDLQLKAIAKAHNASLSAVCKRHQPKTTGEWTGDDDGVLLPMHRFVGKYAKEIAKAHNASLSAQGREVDPVAVQLLQHNDKENQQLRQQLAERDACIEVMTMEFEAHEKTKQQLAAEREKHNKELREYESALSDTHLSRIKVLEHQLAAAREAAACNAAGWNECHQQLAADRTSGKAWELAKVKEAK